MAIVLNTIIFVLSLNYFVETIPVCPIPVDPKFPRSMHVDGETMCPNGCCNWTVDGCCPGSNVIPQDQLDAVESVDLIYHGGDYDTERHGHDHDSRKRRHVEEFVEDESIEDEDDGDESTYDETPYVTGFRILGIIVVVVGLLNLAYPDHLRV